LNPIIDLIPLETDFVQMAVKLTSKCKGKAEVIKQTELKVLVEHEWEIKAEQSDKQEKQNFFWDEKSAEEEKEEFERVELNYNVFNNGPSMSRESKLYAFIPGESALVQNVNVTFLKQPCKLGDLSKNQVPPQPPRYSSSGGGELIYCKNRGDCHVYECDLPKEMEKNQRANVKIHFDFVKVKAKEFKDISKFEIITSICTMNHKDRKGDRCVSGNKKVLKTSTSFEYIRKNTLDLLISSWQYITGAIAGLIVFFIVFVLFYKCNIFSKVRFYKNLPDEEPLDPKEVEVDGENIELRN